jgi:uncharacterized membrane protein YGL010W
MKTGATGSMHPRDASLTPALQAYVRHYAEVHRAPVNQALHFMGIPLLLVSSLGLLAKLSFASFGPAPFQPNAAWIVLASAGIWSVWLDWRFGSFALALWVTAYVLGSGLPNYILAAGFVVGLTAHLVGHFGFEGKPPAVFTEPVAIFEAPVWLLCKLAGVDRHKRA